MSQLPAATVPALLRLGALPRQRWDEALEEVLRIDSELLDVDRVSFWSFQDDPPGIVCELGYVRSKRLFERGTVLLERDCADYLREARRVQVLAVSDARTDARLKSLASYVTSHDVGALMDAPVFAGGRLAGILCHEHVGGGRKWSTHESELALSMSQTLASLVEARARSDAEEAERRAAFVASVSHALAGTFDVAEAQRIAVRRPIPILGEMVSLIGYDGQRAWRVAVAHQDREEETELRRLTNRYGSDVRGPELGVYALREKHSLLLPMTDPESLRAYGLDEALVEACAHLRLRSMMAVPLFVRGTLTGVLTFGSTTRSYGRDELRFAESYAGMVGVLLSNTELYARARDAVQARDEFLSLAAHELRTPLASLTFSAGVLSTELPSGAPASVRRAADVLARQTKRLTRLSDLLIAASKGNGPETPRIVRPVDLVAVVREVIDEGRDALGRANCTPHLDAKGPVMVDGDPAELKVVVSNLLDNAMKFGAGEPIEISVRPQDDEAVLAVRDRGIGISDDEHARLFGRFERGVSAKNYGGLGLGLHISARIVVGHGGRIRAESHGDRGAEVIVELPRAKDE